VIGRHDDRTGTEAWLDVAAAVDYLRATHRLGLTVWHAVEEAIRWWTADYDTRTDDLPDAAFAELPWDDPDPLRSTLERLLAVVAPIGVTDGHDIAAVLSSALTVWCERMAILYNDGHGFANLSSAGGWPTVSRVAHRRLVGGVD
jgi:hypothetical protein